MENYIICAIVIYLTTLDGYVIMIKNMFEYGWEEDPPDKGLIRARTKLGQLRLWRFPREGVKRVNGLDFAGPLEHPGLYILYDRNTRQAYVGETSDLRGRLETHYQKGPKELKDWTDAIVINDGRSYAQSIFRSDVRSYLEKRLISHISSGGIYQVVNKVRGEPRLDVGTKVLAEKLDEELLFVLEKIGFAKILPKMIVPEDYVSVDDVKSMLEAKGYKCKLGEKEGIVDGERAYIRPGSKKRKGWQITIRGKFIQDARSGKGYLIVNRGNCFLIPLAKLKDWLGNKLNTVTRDIYIRLDEKMVYCTKDLEPLDISEFQLKSD